MSSTKDTKCIGVKDDRLGFCPSLLFIIILREMMYKGNVFCASVGKDDLLSVVVVR